ncbi:unnamed protein product [marine sediment metagenome]|uniref:Uncharacterized protein n=1 Tax=marine sediment metagenome TaxID=412755 RepID=X1DSX3_9ZZZZ
MFGEGGSFLYYQDITKRYEAGVSLEEAPPLATFKSDDKQEFITEP